MTYMPWFLRSLVVYLIIVTSISSIEYNPLTFNPHNLEIFNFDEENSNTSDCEPCAVACPANNVVEKDFENLIGRYRAVFIQQIVAVLQQQNPIRLKCNEEIEMSAVLRSKKGYKMVEFGFEVVNGVSTWERVYDWQRNNLVTPWSQRKSTIKKWGLLWLSKIEVRYNFSSRILTSLKYKVRHITSDQLKMKCHHHTLYTTYYNINEYLEKLYTFVNQSKIFSKVKLPEESCRSNDGLGKCVRKHNLVLPYQFRASSPKKILCSNLTSIPLWNDIPEELMDRIQLFIIAIAQVLGKDRELIVLPGVVGQLTLPSITDDKPIKIYLNEEERKVPVPKTNYKIVRYRSHKCDEKAGEICWFDVVIVIQNYPRFTPDEKLCPIDECSRLGWDSIQYLNSATSETDKSPFVYCCELTRTVAKSIGFPLGKTRNRLLHLKFFPMYSYFLKKFEDIDILNEVAAEFEKLVDLKNKENQ